MQTAQAEAQEGSPEHGPGVQLDPKAIARERARAAKAEAKKQQLVKEAATMHKLTGFFRPVRTGS